ncbi:MAG: HesB/IscA family protein [Pikeienuella sp.]
MDIRIPGAEAPSPAATGAPATTEGGITVSAATFARLAEIAAASGTAKALRVAVLGGGCSGFQYEFALEDGPAEGDLVLESDGQRVVIDPESLPFLEGSVIDFKDELIGARFAVENPNASSTCGCGVSFSL